MTEEKVIEALRKVYDPEIPVNVYDLGLIYGIKIDGDRVEILMTLTAPGCPLAAQIAKDAERAVLEAGAKEVRVRLTFDPPWSIDRLTPEGREALRKLGFNV